MRSLGRFEILRLLGEGPRGQVFLGRDPQHDTHVAVKTVRIPAALAEQTEAAVERFLTRAQTLARLRHPGIAAVLEAGRAEGQLFVVSEYVEGTPFAALLAREGRLAGATASELVARAADAVAEAGRVSIAHGNIKPSNLFLVGDAGVRVVDFAVDLSPADALRAAPGYQPPERIRGRDADPRSDVFSLAAVLYELLTGARPFPGESSESILFRIVHEEPVDPTTLDPPLPAATAALLRRGLAKRPEDRFASVAELATALRESDVGLAIDQARSPRTEESAEPATPKMPAIPPAVEPTPAKPPPARSTLRPFILGALLLVLVAAALYATRERWLGPPPAIWWEAGVRTEPAGLPLLLDGQPVSPDGRVRFSSDGPFGEITTTLGCRSASHVLTPEDAAGEIVLVVDPVTLDWQLEAGVVGASVTLNGERVGETPYALELDLCVDNRIEVAAAGFRPATIEISGGATAADARKQLFDVALEAIPRGRLIFPDLPMQLVYYVDGKRLAKAAKDIVLEEGEHVLRYKNEYHFVDRTIKVRIRGDQDFEPALEGVAVTPLVVQAFPSNCKVYVRRPGGTWRYIDETPASRPVALGRYEVKVELNPTGEVQLREIELKPGSNPPVRVSFGRR